MLCPILYEINTRCWLTDLSRQAGKPITLAEVPDTYFAEWSRLGFTHLWLMGVWATGPRARAEALQQPDLRRCYAELLPDWQDGDVAGSPYSIADYTVFPSLGGDEALAQFRKKLNERGIKLILDFVPNHLGIDHPWVRNRPELFVQSPSASPDTFQQETVVGTRFLAHGKDPYFPGWSDTVQVDYRRSDAQTAMTDLLKSVASRCDGVRCDMAMLVLSDVFEKTWSHLPVFDGPSSSSPSSSAQPGRTEFWSAAIPAIKSSQPGFLFLAEAYWGLEGRLRRLGFDYTYDKELYDALVNRDAPKAQHHLLTGARNLIRGEAHFLENHDEPRIASILSVAEQRAAALVMLGVPGMRFLQEGQLTGARIKVPVQLQRRPTEPKQPEIVALYEQLLTTLQKTAVGSGRASLLEPRETWAGNPTFCNFILVLWQSRAPEFDLVAVNLAPHHSQCFAPLAAPITPLAPSELASCNWLLKDLLGPESHVRHGDELVRQGLYLDLPEHGAQVFHFKPA